MDIYIYIYIYIYTYNTYDHDSIDCKNNHLEISKNSKSKHHEHTASVGTSFMILLNVNKVHHFKGLLVPKHFACKNVVKFLRAPAKRTCADKIWNYRKLSKKKWLIWRGLAWHQKMWRLAHRLVQTWYKGSTQVFENKKFLGDLTIPIFSQSIVTFPLMVYFTIWEMHGFSHHFLIAHKSTAKSTLCSHAVLLFLLQNLVVH